MVSDVVGLSECCRLVLVLRSCARGLCGRSFLGATVPLPVPSWTPAERRAYPRSDVCVPDTDEIDSTVLRDSSPLHNRNHAGPKGPGPGDTSSWRGAAGIRSRPARRINTVTKVACFLPWGLVDATLARPGRRTGQRWEPTRAPRQGSKRNEGGPFGSPSFSCCPWHSSLSLLR